MMKLPIFCLAALIPFVASAEHHAEKASDTIVQTAGKYRHVVILKFKEEATAEQIKTIEKEFVALKTKIPTITGIEWGPNVSPENHSQGFTHCFVVSFKDQEGLNVYLPHKAHKDFVKVLLPSLDKIFVVDFVAQ